MRSHLATSFNQNRNTRSFLAISFNKKILESRLAIPCNQCWNMRSLLATSLDEYRNTRSLLAISFNQLEIPSGDSFFFLINMKNEVPSGDLQIVKHEIPFGDLLQLGIPSGDSFYSTGNTRSHLATSKWRNTRSLLAISFIRLGIPSGDSF